MINWLFNRVIDKSERDTGYPADYLRDILATSKTGFFKLSLAFMAGHRKHVAPELHQLAQLGATRQEACGPCLEISKRFAVATGVPETTVHQLLANPDMVEAIPRAAYFLGRHVAGGEPLSADMEGTLNSAIGRHGVAELTVSAALVRLYPALKRGLGYADMCAIPQQNTSENPSGRPAN